MAEPTFSALAETPWLALQGSALLLLLRLPAEPQRALALAPPVIAALLGAAALGELLKALGWGAAPARFLLLPLLLGTGVLGLRLWQQRKAQVIAETPFFAVLLLSPALLSQSLSAAAGTLPLTTAVPLAVAFGLSLPLFAALFARLEANAAGAPGPGLPRLGQRLGVLGLIALGLGSTYGGAA